MRVVLLALSGEATGDCERFGTHGFSDHSEDGGVAEPRDVIRLLFYLLFVATRSDEPRESPLRFLSEFPHFDRNDSWNE